MTETRKALSQVSQSVHAFNQICFQYNSKSLYYKTDKWQSKCWHISLHWKSKKSGFIDAAKVFFFYIFEIWFMLLRGVLISNSNLNIRNFYFWRFAVVSLVDNLISRLSKNSVCYKEPTTIFFFLSLFP